jgi:hypothetical protein
VPRTEFVARTFPCLREFKVELTDLVMQIPQSGIRTSVGAGYLAAKVTVLDGPSMLLQRIQPATKLLPILLMAPAWMVGVEFRWHGPTKGRCDHCTARARTRRGGQ